MGPAGVKVPAMTWALHVVRVGRREDLLGDRLHAAGTGHELGPGLVVLLRRGQRGQQRRLPVQARAAREPVSRVQHVEDEVQGEPLAAHHLARVDRLELVGRVPGRGRRRVAGARGLVERVLVDRVGLQGRDGRPEVREGREGRGRRHAPDGGEDGLDLPSIPVQGRGQPLLLVGGPAVVALVDEAVDQPLDRHDRQHRRDDDPQPLAPVPGGLDRHVDGLRTARDGLGSAALALALDRHPAYLFISRPTMIASS